MPSGKSVSTTKRTRGMGRAHRLGYEPRWEIRQSRSILGEREAAPGMLMPRERQVLSQAIRLDQKPSPRYTYAWVIDSFKSPPAILMFCDILLLIGMVLQVAAAVIYFTSSPQKCDGSFKDPDFMTLCANFWIQTIGLYVILFGIPKLKEPFLVPWILCVTMLSFVCSSTALGIYFLFTMLGDSLMTLTGLLQVWIWKMVIFRRREEDELSSGSSTSSRGC